MYGKEGRLEQQGCAPLKELATSIANAHSVVTWLAAVDVTLIRMPVPPLSSSKLQTALPNLLEDQLLSDVSNCIFTCSKEKGLLRTLAVTRRDCLETVLQTFRELGARHLRVLPAQLSLPYQIGTISAKIELQGTNLALNLRLSEHEGFGLLLANSEQLIPSIRSLVPELAINMYVAEEQSTYFSSLFSTDSAIKVMPAPSIAVKLDDISLDLVAEIIANQNSTWDWRPWRWPLLLGAALLLTQTLALNLDWWHLSREARDLRTSMTQIYLSAYPKETVVLDPLLQMQQKIATNRREAGLSSPDDFNSLVAEFGTAWSATPPPTNITTIEYHDHKLNVTLKDKVSIEAIKAQLAQRGVTIETSPEADHTWIVGSKK